MSKEHKLSFSKFSESVSVPANNYTEAKIKLSDWISQEPQRYKRLATAEIVKTNTPHGATKVVPPCDKNTNLPRFTFDLAIPMKNVKVNADYVSGAVEQLIEDMLPRIEDNTLYYILQPGMVGRVFKHNDSVQIVLSMQRRYSN